MKNYKLKLDAVPFFDEKYAQAILSFESWRAMQVSMSALDEVKRAFVYFGGVPPNGCPAYYGWSKKGPNAGASFYFTVMVPGMSCDEYDSLIKNGEITKLASLLETIANQYFDTLPAKDLANSPTG